MRWAERDTARRRATKGMAEAATLTCAEVPASVTLCQWSSSRAGTTHWTGRWAGGEDWG